MPYNYAREIDDARDRDHDDDEVTAFDLRDEGNSPSRYRSPYRCTDRMCGALDCSNCHPEGEGRETCAQCDEPIAEGEEHQCRE